MAVIILAGLLVSCGGEDVPEETSEMNAPDTEPAETEIQDGLPSDLDYQGKTVNFLYREEVSDKFYVDSEDGDIVHDALYRSFRSVEERLNVEIEVTRRPGHIVSERDNYLNHIRSVVMAGDSAYDFVDIMIGNAPIMVQEGLFKDLAANEHIDLDKPWYIPGITDTVSLDGKVYFVSGDASIDYLDCAFALFFNADTAQAYGVEDLYACVEDGKWTVDKVRELAAQTSMDLNSDGNYTEEDKLGFIVHDYTHTYGIIGSTGVQVLRRLADGAFEFVLGSEHDFDACAKSNELYKNTVGAYYPGISNAYAEHQERYDQITNRFMSGDIFLMTAEIGDSIRLLRNMKSTYGILPFPKFDEAQENYITWSRSTHNAFSMPITCGDPSMAGAVFEALSSSNYRVLVPAYFEVALKTKYVYDSGSARMYDLIRSSMKLDAGFIYNNAFGNPIGAAYNAITAGSELASGIDSTKDSTLMKIEQYMENVRSNCE